LPGAEKETRHLSEKELKSLKDSIVGLDFEATERAAKEAMDKGISPKRAIDALRAAMLVVGEKFEKNEYFLSDLVVAGELGKETMEIIKPYMTKRAEFKGRIVLATVEGDIHDIGKNIVSVMLTAGGFDVLDLGVDVPATKIVEAVREHKPQILGLSALLTLTMVRMEDVIKVLDREGLRRKIRVIVGGSPLTDEFARKIGADHRAVDAVEGSNKCREWTAERS
jgi:5-methyltetrahydrofolate--homocysteine methyltransferase